VGPRPEILVADDGQTILCHLAAAPRSASVLPAGDGAFVIERMCSFGHLAFVPVIPVTA